MTPKISSTLSLLFFLGVALAAPSPQGAPPTTTRIPSSQLLLGKVPRCSSDSDCAHGTACVFSVGCVSRQDLTSQPGFLGDVCASSQLCSNGIRCWNAALDKEENGVCGIYGAPCDNDNHCAFGTKCVHSSGRGLCFGSPSTVPPLSSEAPYPYPSSPAPTPSHGIPSSQGYKDHVLRCSSDHDCHNGDVCVDAVGCVPHADLTSQPGHLGDICASSHDCLNGVSCWASTRQSPTNGVCGVYGAPCSSNAHCTFGNTCNDLGLCSGGHFGVPSAGESYPTSPAYPATSAGSYRAGENVNIHAAAGVGDGAEDSESFLGLNFNALKSYGLAGIALLSLNALLISLIIVVVVLKNKKPQEGSVRPHYQKRASHAAYGKLDSISEVESLRK